MLQPVVEHGQVPKALHGVGVVQTELPLVDVQGLLLVDGRLVEVPGVVKDHRQERVGASCHAVAGAADRDDLRERLHTTLSKFCRRRRFEFHLAHGLHRVVQLA